MFSILSALSAKERRDFLQRSADGMNRAARLGRPLGGIVPLGYTVVGAKQNARFELDHAPLWGGKTAVEIVTWTYELAGTEGKSTYEIAKTYNALGVPTTYARDSRGTRKHGLQTQWTPGRIRNLLIDPRYRGVYQFGRRTKRPRDVIVAEMPRIVSDELYFAAQETLKRNRIAPKGGEKRTYLLRGLVVCGGCGAHFCGVHGRDEVGWYRCNGALTRRPESTRCRAKGIKTTFLEPLIWQDCLTWLRNPAELIAELDVPSEREQQRKAIATERATLEVALAEAQARRKEAIDLRLRHVIEDAELDELLAKIDAERASITAGLERLAAAEPEAEEPLVGDDYLAEIRRRLDEELDFATRQDVVRHLVKRIVVHTQVDEAGKKTARLVVSYRFPAPCGGPTYTVTGSYRNYTQFHTLQRVLVA
jgi:site-specific DNA recombinase